MKITFDSLFLKKIILSFLRAFVPQFALLASPAFQEAADAFGTSGTINLDVLQAALLAAVTSAATAGFRAAQAKWTTAETPKADAPADYQ